VALWTRKPAAADPKSGRARPARYGAPRTITSAATPVRLRDRSELEKIRNRSAVSHAWQMESWRVYDNLGEINFAFNLIGSQFSRIRFHAAVMLSPDEPPTEIADAITLDTGTRELGAANGVDARLAQHARDLVAQLNKGHGLASLQRAYALNRQVAGECYLCLIEGQWSIKSTFEVLVDPGGTIRLQPSVSTVTAMPKEIPPESSVWRMWTQHPRYSLDPDCNLRSVLYLCEQLIKLNRMINNTVASRMNAGILKVASEIIQAAKTPGAEGAVDDNGEEELDPFRADLHATMTQPILDDASGAAVIPMVAEVPYAMMDGIQWMSLARDIDQHMTQYAENVLGRILNGISIPKDSITGYQNVRYANAQQISQDLYSQAVEPLALALSDDLTDVFLRPLLESEIDEYGWDPDQVKKMVIWYDPSEIVTRPDRGADADAGWDRGALSDDAWRKSHGFSAEDKPSEEELLKRMMLRSAQLPPNLIDYMARHLLPEYFEDAPPLVTQTQAGMDQAATEPLGPRAVPHPHPFRNPANNLRPREEQNPAGSQDQEPPPGGTLPPRAVGG
jgi:hypothetical protein